MSNILLIAQAAGNIVHYAKVAIIVAAVITIMLIALQAFKIPIPMWVWQIFGVALVAVTAIFVINLLTSAV
jgi:hypothetical protein